MKKETLLQIVLGTIGGLLFSIGMCMCLIPEWNLFTIGIVIAIVGIITLLCIIPLYKKIHPKKERNKKLNKRLVLTFVIGILASLTMGFGMSKILMNPQDKVDILIGMITGVIGLLICILNYPVYAYLESNKKN